jgi:DNA-binding XRE family transcriptional regulator
MTKPKPLEFSKVESLRKHMMLTITDMASVVGVSRMTYHSWKKGTPIRKDNDIKLRDTLRKLLSVMQDKGWPSPDVIVLEPKDRKKQLVEYLEEYH